MSRHPVIDGLEFARTGAKLKGSWPVNAFGRLHDALRSTDGTLSYELRGVPEQQGRPALRLTVEGTLQLLCQRCLAALEFPLHIEVALLLAATQAEIDAEPVAADGPESIVAGREMQVQALVEDEVLLAIPIAPRHETCAGEAEGLQGSRQKPFAGLRGMIGSTKH